MRAIVNKVLAIVLTCLLLLTTNGTPIDGEAQY